MWGKNQKFSISKDFQNKVPIGYSDHGYSDLGYSFRAAYSVATLTLHKDLGPPSLHK